MSARRLAALATSLAALALSACGGGSSTPADDPATAVPADAALYIDTTVRPEGSTKEALTAALSKLLGTKDPGSYWISRIDQSLAADKLTYARDIEPWLGQQVGVFFTSFGSNAQGAGVIQTTDPKAALDALRKGAANADQKLRSSTYRGTGIEAGGGNAYATVGNLALAGTRSGVEAAIDASKGSSLARSSGYSSSLSGAPSDRFLTIWADPSRVLDALVGQGSLTASEAAQLRSQAGRLLRSPVTAWGDAASNYLALELSTAAGRDASPPPPSLISGFPDDSWLAFGASGFGQGFAQGLRDLRSAGTPAGTSSLDRIRSALGVDVGNIGKWLGDVSGYVSGSSIIDLTGAVVLSSRDRAASATSLGQLQTAFEHDVDVVTQPLGGGQTGFTVTPRGAPVQFVFTQIGGKVIAGLGQDSISAALNPARTLADSPTFKSATGALGGLSPSFYLDFQPIAGLFSIPGVITDPRFEQIQPYLNRLDYLVAGGGVKDGRVLTRIVLGVRGGADSGSVASAGVPAYGAIGP